MFAVLGDSSVKRSSNEVRWWGLAQCNPTIGCKHTQREDLERTQEETVTCSQGGGLRRKQACRDPEI
jgi:hypothetical protein